MREFIKKHHILMKLLSLLIAIILWVVVINADNPRKTLEFQNLPVELLEQDTLLTRYGLVVSEIDTETVSVIQPHLALVLQEASINIILWSW